jgi:hypothetical protein
MKTKELTEPAVLSRQDVTGRWHRVASAPCEACGCCFEYSLDEPGVVVWEAGDTIEEGCLDDLCDCHVAPVSGLRFKLNLVSTAP